MANASKTHIGRGAKGKSSGGGALTNLPKDRIEENMVLSNRDSPGIRSKGASTESRRRPSSFRIMRQIA